MKIRALSFFLGLSLLSSLLVAPLSVSAQTDAQQAQGVASGAAFPVTGVGTAGSGAATFDGVFNIQRFRIQDGKLMAIGRLAGTVTETVSGKTTKMDEQEVRLPVQSINGKVMPTGSGDEQDEGDGTTGLTDETAVMLEMAQAAPAPSCNILNLILGPLHLNLLGLVVDLNQVVLNITGQTGAGNLLGNLLCAVTGLLDRTGTLGVLTNLLNAIVDLRRLGIV